MKQYYAAKQGNLEVLDAILNTNIDVNQKSEDGYKQTALFTLAEVGWISTVRMLLEHSADPDISVNFNVDKRDYERDF